MQEKEEIQLGEETFEVPSLWAETLKRFSQENLPIGQRVYIFTVTPPPERTINAELFRGVFCDTVKVDPPPITIEIGDKTHGQVLKVLTLGDACSGRARVELHSLLPKTVDITEKTVVYKG